MLGKSKPKQLLWRALPLRNEQLSYIPNGDLLTVDSVWFTPETIIFDAIDMATDLLWFWEAFKKALPSHILRVFTLVLLSLIAVGFNQSTFLSAASVPAETALPVETSKDVQISTQIKAKEKLTFSWPVHRSYISTPFSGYHKGIDIPNPHGAVVHPFAFGTVVFAGWDPHGFGNTVQIRHEKGYSTRYAHLSSVGVVLGQKVSSNTAIGRVGATGVAYGSHLHFEIYKNNVVINPLNVLP